jgi:molybdate transport system regulatory protein
MCNRFALLAKGFNGKLTPRTGGRNGGGAVLTPLGISPVARYRKIERAATTAVRKELVALRAEIGPSGKAASR